MVRCASYQTTRMTFLSSTQLVYQVGLLLLLCYFAMSLSILGPIGDHDDVKKCLQAAPKLLLTIRTLLTSV